LLDANIIGNYFINGPSTSVSPFTRGNENFHGYVKNNYHDSDRDGTLNGKEIAIASSNYGGMAVVDKQYSYPSVARLFSPAEALSYILTCESYYYI